MGEYDKEELFQARDLLDIISHGRNLALQGILGIYIHPEDYDLLLKANKGYQTLVDETGKDQIFGMAVIQSTIAERGAPWVATIRE